MEFLASNPIFPLRRGRTQNTAERKIATLTIKTRKHLKLNSWKILERTTEHLRPKKVLEMGFWDCCRRCCWTTGSRWLSTFPISTTASVHSRFVCIGVWMEGGVYLFLSLNRMETTGRSQSHGQVVLMVNIWPCNTSNALLHLNGKLIR